MTKEIENTTELLALDTITEPFNLATALQYMDEHGEFIRYKTETDDFYMYKDVQKRPTMVHGRRKFVDVETVWAFNQWGSSVVNFDISNFMSKNFYIMQFDEQGNPDWSWPKEEGTGEKQEG